MATHDQKELGGKYLEITARIMPTAIMAAQDVDKHRVLV